MGLDATVRITLLKSLYFGNSNKLSDWFSKLLVMGRFGTMAVIASECWEELN